MTFFTSITRYPIRCAHTEIKSFRYCSWSSAHHFLGCTVDAHNIWYVHMQPTLLGLITSIYDDDGMIFDTCIKYSDFYLDSTHTTKSK